MSKILELGIDYVLAWLLALIIFVSYVVLLIKGIQPTEAINIALGAAIGYVFSSVSKNGRNSTVGRTVTSLLGDSRKAK